MGEEHVLEFQIVGKIRFASDLLDRIRPDLAMTDHPFSIDRIGDLRWPDRLTGPQGTSRIHDGVLDGGVTRATAEGVFQCVTQLI